MCLIYRCLSSASAVICPRFIYELGGTHSTLSTSEIPPVKSPHAFGFPIVNTPMASEFHNHEPPSPSEILKAVHGIGMDIFWNRTLGGSI